MNSNRIRVGDRVRLRSGTECTVFHVTDPQIVPDERLHMLSGDTDDGRCVGAYLDDGVSIVCPHCNGTRERVQFSRSRWGDETDPCARKVPCECVEGRVYL